MAKEMIKETVEEGTLEGLRQRIQGLEGSKLFVHTHDEGEIKVRIHCVTVYPPSSEWWTERHAEVHICAPRRDVCKVELGGEPPVTLYRINGWGFITIGDEYFLVPTHVVEAAWARIRS